MGQFQGRKGIVMQQQVERRQVRAPRLRNVRGVGMAASWAICVAAAADFGTVVLDWRRADAWRGDPVGEATTLEWVSAYAAALYLVAAVVAAVLFIVWLVRARENSEFLCDAKHRYARVWSGLGWFVPVAALWVPAHVVQNVAAASDPRTAVHNAWIDNIRDSTVSLWWTFWIGSSVCNFIALYTDGQIGTTSYASPASVAIWSTLSALAGAAAAVLAVLVIRMINRRQSARPAVPWWG